MSCLRLAGLSEGEVSFLAWASPAQRWLANITISSREMARRCVMWRDLEEEGGSAGEVGVLNIDMPGRRKGKMPDIVLPWRVGDMERDWEGQLVASASRRLHEMMPTLHVAHTCLPTAQAPPAQLLCSSRGCVRRQQEALQDIWMRRLLLGGFRAGHSPLVWHDSLRQVPPLNMPIKCLTKSKYSIVLKRALLTYLAHCSCVSTVPASLQTHGSPWPNSFSMMQGLYSRLGSNSIQKPDMSKLVSDAGKLRLLDTLLPKLKAGGHKVCCLFSHIPTHTKPEGQGVNFFCSHMGLGLPHEKDRSI